MQYTITNKQDELYHYGVKGMRWGVRRATKQLSRATTKEDRDKAVARLNKHRTKGSNEIAKLKKQKVQLKKDVDRHINKTDIYTAKKTQEIARLRKKAYGTFTSQDKSAKLLFKANKLETKVNDRKARSENAKAKLAKNEKMQEMFRTEIGKIDKTLSDKGRKYING